MKKVLGILFISLIAVSCGTTKFSATGDKEKKFVDHFLNLTDKNNLPKYEELMQCISPKYIMDSNINVSGYKVDNYITWGHSIENYSNNGMITAKIWGQDRQWVHTLIFKLSKEKGKLYLVPSAHNNNYITPWWERKTYIKENK